jgi:hypothetical protein
MKKLLTLSLVIVLFLAFTGYTVRAEMRLTTSLKETQYIDGVRHTKIIGELEYDGVLSDQVINYLGANVQNYSDLNVVVGDNYKPHDSWGRGTLLGHIEDIHNRYENYEVIGGVNGDFYNTSITNLNGQPQGLYVRNFETIASGVVSSRPAAGFKDDGTVVFGVPCYQGYVLLVYDEDGALKKEVSVERINNLPTSNELITVYFDNYDLPISTTANKIIIEAKETKMDGVRYFGSGVLENQTDVDMTVEDHTFVIVGHDFNEDDFITALDYVVVQRKLGCGFEDVRFAVGVYDELVTDGIPVTHLDYGLDPEWKHPRTAIGQKEDGTVFFVTVDGRNKPLGMDGVNLYELAQIMVYFGADKAYNIDGGGSTTMALKNTEGTYDIMNTPSDGTVRAVTNGVYLVKGEHIPRPNPVGFPDPRIKLDRPLNLYVDQTGDLRFDPIQHSLSYMVSINGELFETEESSMTLDLAPGEYVIKVRALADQINYKNSDYSEEFVLIVRPDDINHFIDALKEFLLRETQSS